MARKEPGKSTRSRPGKSRGKASAGSKGRQSQSSRKRPTKTAPRRAVARGTAGKVGTSTKAAKAFGAGSDFGASESDLAERQYVSQATRRRDRGADVEHARGEEDRTSGAGANESGPGS